MMLVAPSESAPANVTFNMFLAKSQTGWRIFWCAAVISQFAV